MLIEVKGNSGCTINIVEHDNKLAVHKSTFDKGYVKRLINQANKQKSASLIANIEVPKIYEVISSDDSATIIMDYIHAKNFVDFIEQSPISAIDDFTKSIITYIDKEIESSHEEVIPLSVFTNKIDSILHNAEKNSYVTNNIFCLIKEADLAFKQCGDIKLPIGVCHGDLTLSNILFSSNKYYLIDFLDSFIETPIQDIVKLRQDTSLFWSLQMYDKAYDKIRIKTVFDYIDDAINSHFNATCYCYRNAYSYIQLINILRIVPYAKSPAVAEYLEKTLTLLLGNLK
jgi:tRNA A-37 threonylcarbamoyl transferase component Bud32